MRYLRVLRINIDNQTQQKTSDPFGPMRAHSHPITRRPKISAHDNQVQSIAQAFNILSFQLEPMLSSLLGQVDGIWVFEHHALLVVLDGVVELLEDGFVVLELFVFDDLEFALYWC